LTNFFHFIMPDPTGAVVRSADLLRGCAGLEVDWADLSSTLSKRAWITQTPAAFDFESSYRLPQFHHTGPFHDGKGREKAEFP
jgi:hypothetical protein